MGLVALLLVGFTVVFLDLEVGAGILLHVTQSIWVTLLVYPLLYLLAFLLLGLMVPGMDERKGWAILAMITVPIGAHRCSGRDAPDLLGPGPAGAARPRPGGAGDGDRRVLGRPGCRSAISRRAAG